MKMYRILCSGCVFKGLKYRHDKTIVIKSEGKRDCDDECNDAYSVCAGYPAYRERGKRETRATNEYT